MYQPRVGCLTKVFDGATSTQTVTLPPNPWGRDLLIVHQMTGSEGCAGMCQLTLTPAPGVQVPHHGDAVGLPIAATGNSYSAIVRDVTEVVTLTLTVVSGTHTVWVQYLA